MENEKVTYFAETDHRNRKTKFGIQAKDRTKHMYVIGKTGMGKSTMLENMAVQDIQNGNGLAFIDPHGATAEKLLDYIPEHRVDDVIYFAPFDVEHPISFNVMEDVGEEKRHLVLDGLMSAFKKIWADQWSSRMEYILGNTILALLEYPDSSLLGINRMYADKEYREKVVAHVSDPLVKAFWSQEFANYTDRYAQEATPAIQNKVGQFTNNPLIRNIVGQTSSSFDIRKIMDEKKIMIINLSKGRVGEQNANLLGSMLITKMYLAAMSRADLPSKELNDLPNFYLYVDEFQSFANESFANILSEARKYKLNLTVAHQYIEQMSEEVRAAVFGNVGTMISFRVGSYDAEILEKEFSPQFTSEDMVNLGFAQIYLKLMVDGISSAPFSARTLPPISEPQISYHDVAKARSRAQYASPRAEVELIIQTEQDAAIQSAGKNSATKNKKPYPQSQSRTPHQSRAPLSEPRNTDTRPEAQSEEPRSAPQPEKMKAGNADHLKSLREVLEEAVGKDRIEKSLSSPKENQEESPAPSGRGKKTKAKEEPSKLKETEKEKAPSEISKKKLKDLLHVEKEET